MKPLTIEDFYKDTAKATQENADTLLPPCITKEIGHFNVFSVADLVTSIKPIRVLWCTTSGSITR